MDLNTLTLQLVREADVRGVPIEPDTRARSEAIFDELRPPVVVPVKVPRRLLQGDGPIRLLLELTIVDDDLG